MKKLLILILAAAILFSGCVDKTVQTVKNGDNISVDYVGSFQDGKVFDTSIESVARANNLSNPSAQYEPLNFTVGTRSVIEGFDEGVIGMKVGDTKTLTIPPEKGYPVDPSRIQVSPIIQDLPATSVIPRVLEVPSSQFEQIFGPNHSVGDTVTIPDTNINLTITNMTPEISLKYNLIVGSNIWDSRAPWNETVIKIDDKNITVKPKITKNEMMQKEEKIVSVLLAMAVLSLIIGYFGFIPQVAAYSEDSKIGERIYLEGTIPSKYILSPIFESSE